MQSEHSGKILNLEDKRKLLLMAFLDQFLIPDFTTFSDQSLKLTLELENTKAEFFKPAFHYWSPRSFP